MAKLIQFRLLQKLPLSVKIFKTSDQFGLKAYTSNFAAGHNKFFENPLIRNLSSSRDCEPCPQKKPCPDKPACDPPKPPSHCPAACAADPKCNPTSIANLEGKIGSGKFVHPHWFSRPLLKWSFIYYYKEVVTLIVIFGGSFVLLGIMLLRIWSTRNDWMFTGHVYPYEKWDLRKPTIMKIITINQPYRPMPFLQGLLEDIRKCESKRKPKSSGHGH